ncbi:MAG: DUF4330 domain-containing protein [Oscillospiraceae bacterium]|nr:DUF4330 domain-containing protein [Oscillospiraceae bacterium]
MDKNGKIAGKVSIIDILVILLIVVVIAGIAVRYGSSITTSAVKSEAEFEYVLKVDNVRSYTVTALEKIGKITDKKSETELGEIVDVEVEDATQLSTTVEGELINAELPGRYTCYVTIRAAGKESEDNYVLDDSTELSVGRNVDLYSKYVKTSGDITSVKVVE